MSKWFIIAGHGGGDSGAVGHGFQEQERVRALGYKLQQYGGGNIVLGDFSRNYYKDNLIHTIPKGYKVMELHLDANNSPSAKGGHVIILGGIGGADQWDNAIANFVGAFFPGRSSLIVERTNLANPSRAYQNGLNYRLLECCFISNLDDLTNFNNRLDEFAQGLVQCMLGSVPAPSPAPSPQPTPSPSGYTGTSIVDYLNSVGKDSSFNARKTYAAQYGISGYTGTASQNTALLNAMRGGSAPATSSASVETMVQEVIRGLHGNGHAAREASLRAKYGNIDYQAVRARVNQLM